MNNSKSTTCSESTRAHNPTDLFEIYAVRRDADQAKAGAALAPMLTEPADLARVFTRGVFAPVAQAMALRAAVRPHGYAVRGQDTGKIGGAWRRCTA